MNKFALIISSLFNIDLSAILFITNTIEEDASVLLYLNDKVKIASNSNNRKYESRLSIPLFKWEMDENNDWRLIHVPIEYVQKDILYHFNRIQKTYLQRSPKYKINNINAFFEDIKRDLEDTNIYIGVLKKILHKFNPEIKFHINKIDDLYNVNNSDILSAIVNSLNNIFSSLENNIEYKFSCGGKIIFDGEFSFIVKEIKKKEGGELYFNNQKQSIYVTNLLYSINNKKTSVRYQGMLESYYLNYYGSSMHLPSYFSIADAPSFSSPNSFYEFITPISNKDVKRTSQYYTQEFRLYPLGYSLIDIDKELYRDFLASIFHTETPKDFLLNDWFNLYSNYPKCSEKVAADQNPVKSYIDNKLKFIIKQLYSGNYEHISFIINEQTVTIYNMGDYFLQVNSFLRHVLDIIHKPNMFDERQKTYIDRIFLSNPHKLLYNLKESVLYVCSILNDNGLNIKIKGEIYKLIQSFEIALVDSFSDYEKVIASAMTLTKEVCFQYYKYVAFINSTVFKSNIFFLSMLFSKEELLNKIAMVLEKRKVPYLKMEPKFIIKSEG